MDKEYPPGFPLPPQGHGGEVIAAGDMVEVLSIPTWLVRDLEGEEREAEH